MRLLVLDNYDSFTYNLVHLVEKCSAIPFDVIKNDLISLDEVASYSKILLSPGPGLPSEAGIMPALLKRYTATKSIFGVCLGLQAIAENYGGKLRNLKHVMHGLATPINILEQDKLFDNCPLSFKGGRYHSWVVDEHTVPAELIVTAKDNDGCIMAMRHKHHDVCGVQFHPESILSEQGETIIGNWLK